MESIEIKGFLTIDYAHFEIKKINILIGAQAQGKSVIAKLLYFLKKNFADIFLESIKNFESKREINKKCLIQFEKIFPRYSWANQEFSIIYSYEDYDISIIRTKLANKYTLKLNYCKELANSHKNFKKSYKHALDTFDTNLEQESIKTQRRANIFDKIIIENIRNSVLSNIYKIPIFIPASRSFFANLQKNIFSFLANDIDIDPFIKEFGSRYENSKSFHHGIFSRYSDSTITRKKVDKLINDIVVGEYVYADEQDWILNDEKRTNLAHASSGQQESLPMLLVLKTFPFIYGKERPPVFFIEEPEAHLFPTSQKQIISLIATIYNTFGHSFFITTHSPYILTAINNLVVGKDAYEKIKNDSEKLKTLEQAFALDELIALEDVSAYTLKNGKLESIINWENRLIGANILDSVSDEFDSAFDVATQILYGDD